MKPEKPAEGIAYDQAVYSLTVTVSDQSDGSLALSHSLHKGTEAAEALLFRNTYTSPSPELPSKPNYPAISVPIQAGKRLIGGRLQEGQFSFVLKDAAGTALARASHDAEGQIHFPDRTFSRTGVFMYSIRELAGEDPSLVYDDTEYCLRISVMELDGRLSAEVDWYRNGTPTAGPIQFENQRLAPQTGDTALRLPLILLTLSAALSLGWLLLRRRAYCSAQVRDRR